MAHHLREGKTSLSKFDQERAKQTVLVEVIYPRAGLTATQMVTEIKDGVAQTVFDHLESERFVVRLDSEPAALRWLEKYIVPRLQQSVAVVAYRGATPTADGQLGAPVLLRKFNDQLGLTPAQVMNILAVNDIAWAGRQPLGEGLGTVTLGHAERPSDV